MYKRIKRLYASLDAEAGAMLHFERENVQTNFKNKIEVLNLWI
jgi:hypothetical protein